MVEPSFLKNETKVVQIDIAAASKDSPKQQIRKRSLLASETNLFEIDIASNDDPKKLSDHIAKQLSEMIVQKKEAQI